MGAVSEFAIPYLGLSNGPHTYNFKIEPDFFSRFEKSSIENGSFEITAVFDKQDRMVVLSIMCDGSFDAECDRCLVDIQVPVQFKDQVVIKIEEAPIVQKDEVYYLSPGTSHIDLTPMIYEMIHLHLPVKNIRDCSGEDYRFCDQAVLTNLGVAKQEKTSIGENPWKTLDKLNLE